jgi:hypothetical protein
LSLISGNKSSAWKGLWPWALALARRQVYLLVIRKLIAVIKAMASRSLIALNEVSELKKKKGALICLVSC